jgi:hypothetical protein
VSFDLDALPAVRTYLAAAAIATLSPRGDPFGDVAQEQEDTA